MKDYRGLRTCRQSRGPLRPFSPMAFCVKTLLLLALLVVFQSVYADPFDDALVAYRNGDYEAALKGFRTLAEQDHVPAQYILGLLYTEGHGVPKDYNQAVKWIRKAADSGFPVAQYDLGMMYKDGLGVPQDFQKAIRWTRKAAELGFDPAQFNLGVSYERGLYVTQDHKEAMKWYRKAAEQGNVDAQNNLGSMYYDGRGVTRNYEAAAKWFREAADQGFANAQNNLALMYKEGRGVPQDYSAAVQWFRKAADQGNVNAQHNLGGSYLEGLGVQQDYKEAAKWYQKAAEQGLPKAQFVVGVMYKDGLGVSQDDIRAQMWFDLAAAGSYVKARRVSQELAGRMNASQIAEAQRLAQEWRDTHRGLNLPIHERSQIIHFPHFYLTVPSNDIWEIESLGDRQAALTARLGNAFYRITLLENFLVDKSMKGLSTQHAANHYRNQERLTMIEKGVKPGLYELHDLTMGQELIGKNLYYTMKYLRKHKDQFESAQLYVFFPLEKGNEFFLVAHYSELAASRKLLTQSLEPDFLKILKTVSSNPEN